MKLKFKAAFALITVFSSMFLAPVAANATVTVSTSDLSLRLTPGIVPPTTFTTDQVGQACFPFTGGPARSLYFQNVELNYRLSGYPHSEQLRYTIEQNEGVYDLCLYPEVGPDFANATEVTFTGTLRQSTSFNATFGSYLASKSLTLLDSYISFDGTKSYFEATIKNNTSAGLSYKVSGLSIDNQKVERPLASLILAANATTWVRLGELPGDYEKNFVNLDLGVVLTNGTYSKLKPSGLKLPKGISVVPNSAADWNFPSYNPLQPGEQITLPCLKLKNNTGKAIAIKSTFSWKNGKKSIKGNFGEVRNMGIGETVCVSGIDSNDKYFAGDVRLGGSLAVSGKVSLVKSSTFDTTALVLGGYTLQGTPTITYDAAKKTSMVTIAVTHATLFGDALLTNPKINGAQTDSAVVAGSCECGGDGYDYHSRRLTLSAVKGDLRVGKKLQLSGTVQNSTPLTFSYGIDGAQSDDGGYGCQIYHPEITSTYDAKTNLTNFKVSCYNNTAVARSIDFSQVGAVAEEPGQANRNYSVIASALRISLPAKLSWKEFTVFQLVGDWRTGSKTLTINGYAILR